MLRCSAAGLRAGSPLLAPCRRHGGSQPGVALLPGGPARRLPWQALPGGAAAGRRRRSLRLPCAARMTSSRGSIDEDQLELQSGRTEEGGQQRLPAGNGLNGSGRGVPSSPPSPAAAGQQRQEEQWLPSEQQQQQAQQDLSSSQQQARQPGAERSQPGEPPPGQGDLEDDGGVPLPHQLTLKQLQALTELHVEDAYACGVVGSAAELAECLGTDLRDGLCEDQERLAARAARYGTNTTRPPKEVTFLQLVVEALKDFTILVLLGAGCLSLGLELLVNRKAGGESSWIEGASILAAVCVVVLVTAVNNYQKEQQFRMLQAVSSDVKVRAIRNGREVELPVRDVLVGDLLLVETGDILCTDGLLVAGCDVKVDESHLTGESDDVTKDTHSRPTLLGGSKVLSGFGRMLVTAVGPNSQSGRIAEMVADGKTSGAAAAAAGMATAAGDGLREETLLQQKLAEYATSIGKFGLGAAVLATLAMTARFSFETFVVQQAAWDWSFLQDYLRFFITGVTILVVAVPEGLPLAVTLALAFSVRRMLADHNLVRHLSAAETMGTATVVCSDKTGTLTQNNMVVSKLWLAGHLLPDLKPYTRKGGPARSDARRPWERKGAAAAAAPGGGGAGAGGKAAGGQPGGKAAGGKSGNGGAELPPLLQVLTSQDSISSICGSASMDAFGGGSRASILESITAGSQAPADIVQLLLESIALNSTANIYTDKDGQERRIGNRTEIALLELARLLGGSPRKLRRQQHQLAQVAFSSERKRMTTAALPPGHDDDSVFGARLCRIYTKGAPEIVLDRCTYVLGPDGCRRRLTPEDREALVREFGQGGQRVLALAYRDISVPAETVGPPRPVPADAAWQTLGGRLTGSDSDDSRSSSGSEEGRPPRAPSPGAPTGTMSEENGWRWDAGSLNAVLSSSDESDAAWDEGLTLADNLESNLTLLAVVGIQDPLRPEVPAAILQCQASGITVKMLTGDNIGTATAIAQECGILPPAGTSMDEWLRTHCAATEATARGAAGWFRDPTASGSSIVVGKSGASLLASVHSMDSHSKTVDHEQPGHEGHCGLPEGVVMEGSEFRQRVLNEDGSINSGEFLRLWPRLRVLARCTPADKYAIVTGVRSLTKDVVAVTGDGTNDAPALRAANVGFAMNVGTDTAKEAADIVLLDNNFASIVSAVLWGRNVYCNITRFLQFQLTINLVAVATAVTGAIVATESPLTAVQMLWVNMIMDSLASLALATEPPDTRILALPPFSQEHDFVDPNTPTVKHIAGQAIYQLAVMYGLIFYAPALLGIPDHSVVAGPSEHYTMVFNTFVFMQLFNQLNARKIIDTSLAWEGLSNAKWFQSILAGELLLQILIVQFGGQWFHTHPLNATEWAVCVGLGATTLGLREILRRVPYGRWWFSLGPPTSE